MVMQIKLVVVVVVVVVVISLAVKRKINGQMSFLMCIVIRCCTLKAFLKSL